MKFRDKSILGFLRFPISVALTPGFNFTKTRKRVCHIKGAKKVKANDEL